MMKCQEHGYTLIELSVSMTIGSALLILSVSLVHQVMRYQSVTRDREAEHRVFDRLGSEFRRDVHRATSANLVSPREIEFLYDDNTQVRFQANEKSIIKTKRDNDKVVQTESYEFNRSIVSEMSISGEPEQVSLSVGSQNSIIGNNLVPQRRITATLSRLIRLQQAEVIDE